MAGGMTSAERREAGRRELQAIKDALADRIYELASELLRGGRKSECKNFWEASNIGCTGKGTSLKVNLKGKHQGLWKDFALSSGMPGSGGSALDLIREIRCGGDIADAIKEAKSWLEGKGWSADPARISQDTAAMDARRAKREAEAADEVEAKRTKAGALWHGAELGGRNPAIAYLQCRAIDFARLGKVPGSLRYRPDVWNAEARRRDGPRNAKLPAMIACIMGLQGELRGVHRTWLDLVDWNFATREGRVEKARLVDPKRSLGPYRGGHIPLWKGEHRQTLRDIPEGTPIYASEGIENGLSVALAKPDARIIAAVSLSNLAALELPAQMGPLTIIADNDGDNATATAGLEKAIAAHQAQGREVKTMFPPAGFKDWNDFLRGKRQ